MTAAKEPLKGWALLHSALPKEALRAIDKSVYGTEGLTDVNDAYLLERLYESGLPWEFNEPRFEDLGTREAVRFRGKPNEYTVDEHVVACNWSLTIDGRTFYGRGVHEDAKLEVATKGAQTGAFKVICKYLGMDKEVRKGQQSDDQLRTAAGADGGFDSKSATARARAAYVAAGLAWPECDNHGDKLQVREKAGKYRIACPEKVGGGFCPTVLWSNQIPPAVLAAIKAEVDTATVDDPQAAPGDAQDATPAATDVASPPAVIPEPGDAPTDFLWSEMVVLLRALKQVGKLDAFYALVNLGGYGDFTGAGLNEARWKELDAAAHVAVVDMVRPILQKREAA